MKKTKVKKIKNIPKYGGGTSYIPAGLQKDFNLKFNAPQGMNVNNVQQGSVANAAQQADTYGGYSNTHIPSGLTTGANELIKSTFGIKQNSAAAVTMDSTAQGAELGMSVGGPWGALIGAGVGFGLGAFKKGGIDKSAISATSDIKESWRSGGIFGNGNYDEQMQIAAGIQNSKQSVEQTSHLQEQWANDPRNQRAVLNVKDGGVVPGEHYSSRLEVETDSDGNNAVRYAWDPKGKDTYHIYINPDGSSAEGNMIFNEEGVKRPNGMKYSDTAEKMIKNIKDPKLRKISLKKLAAEQEIEKAKEGKTKNGIPAYAGGGDGNGGKWSDRVRNYIESVVEPAIVDYVHRATYDPYGFSGSTFVPTDRRIIGDNLEKELLKFSDSNIPITSGTMVGTTISPDDWGWSNKSKAIVAPTSKQVGYTFTDKDLNLFDKYPWMTAPAEILNTQTVKKADAPVKKTTSALFDGEKEEKVTLSRPFKLSKEVLDATTPSGPTKNDLVNTTIKKYGGNDKPIYRLLTQGQPVTQSQPDYKATSGSGMLDAYQWLSALVPLMDREKAEKVTLSRPTWKGIPVGVDILKQLQDAQLGHDISNYNTTQGGYTAGQQLAARVAAADNLARQRAAIHAWQTQQQNENIAKNIASYNDHTRLLSEINDREADMNAANRGAARNINRQNRSQAFKNIGQILRDKKQYDMDLIRTEILKPMIEAVYENSDVVIPMLNKQIKKKSTKKSKGE